MQAKTVVLRATEFGGLAEWRVSMIQLYHDMDTLVMRLWRALTAPRDSVPVPPGGVRVFVTQLAAERSHCRWCIERGRHLWREAQLPVDALHALLRYETSALFSNRERAALRFTDAVTQYSEAQGGMPSEPLMRARQHLSEPEIAAVTALVAAQHFFNPITGALGADVAPWGAPVGSSIRNLWL